MTLTIALLVASGCGASVDTVEEAVGKTSTTVRRATSVDTATTTTAPRSTTTRAGGGSTDPGAAGPYVDAMTESMLADEDFPATREHAECLAERFVDIIGTDRLQSAGVTPEQFGDDSLDFSDIGLTEAQANKMYDAFGACDFDLRELMLEDMGDDGEMTPAARECMEQVLTDDNLRKLMVGTMIGGDDAIDNDPELEQIMTGFMACAFMSLGEGDSEFSFE